MNHSLNYNNYLETIKNDVKMAGVGGGGSVGSEDHQDEDHFDPVAFYSSVEDDGNGMDASTSKLDTIPMNSTPNLRRSGRPKPATESLISSPPAIKFYESTIIRNKSRDSVTSLKKKKPSNLIKESKSIAVNVSSGSGSSANNNINDVNDTSNNINESSILKLRLPMSNHQYSKENVSDKKYKGNGIDFEFIKFIVLGI